MSSMAAERLDKWRTPPLTEQELDELGFQSAVEPETFRAAAQNVFALLYAARRAEYGTATGDYSGQLNDARSRSVRAEIIDRLRTLAETEFWIGLTREGAYLVIDLTYRWPDGMELVLIRSPKLPDIKGKLREHLDLYAQDLLNAYNLLPSEPVGVIHRTSGKMYRIQEKENS